MRFSGRLKPKVSNIPDYPQWFGKRRFRIWWNNYELQNNDYALQEILEGTDLIHPVTQVQLRYGRLEICLPDEEAATVMVARDAMEAHDFGRALKIMIQYPHLATLVISSGEISKYFDDASAKVLHAHKWEPAWRRR